MQYGIFNGLIKEKEEKVKVLSALVVMVELLNGR
jgi:hypothetical protein